MPRLTSSPSFSSRATRFAISTLSSIGSAPLNDVVDADKWRGHHVWRNNPYGHDVLRFGNHRPAGLGHHRVEIASRQGILQIAVVVRAVGGDQREVGGHRFL